MDRAKAAHLAELGLDPDQAKRDREELAEMKAAEEERKKAAMTELDRLKAEKAEAELKIAAAERAAALSAETAAITALCAQSGVRDVDYARYRLKDIPEAERATKLAEWLTDDTERARFNVGSHGPPAPAQTTTTTPASGAPAPAHGPPTPMAGQGGVKSVDDMTRDEYQAYKQSKHGL
jgi:hypothetical protein